MRIVREDDTYTYRLLGGYMLNQDVMILNLVRHRKDGGGSEHLQITDDGASTWVSYNAYDALGPNNTWEITGQDEHAIRDSDERQTGHAVNRLRTLLKVIDGA